MYDKDDELEKEILALVQKYILANDEKATATWKACGSLECVKINVVTRLLAPDMTNDERAIIGSANWEQLIADILTT
jgi:hypothetical protein